VPAKSTTAAEPLPLTCTVTASGSGAPDGVLTVNTSGLVSPGLRSRTDGVAVTVATTGAAGVPAMNTSSIA
jgi:hypothetical protein